MADSPARFTTLAGFTALKLNSTSTNKHVRHPRAERAAGRAVHACIVHQRGRCRCHCVSLSSPQPAASRWLESLEQQPWWWSWRVGQQLEGHMDGRHERRARTAHAQGPHPAWNARLGRVSTHESIGTRCEMKAKDNVNASCATLSRLESLTRVLVCVRRRSPVLIS